jgi:hypothetical protein
MHDCPCCGDIIYGDVLLCDGCIEAGCEPNGEGSYDNCQRDCATCGVPALADFYFCVVYVGADGETTYTDGYVCEDHVVEDGEVYAPAGAQVLEFELREITR